jgi:hypothetical protein
MKIDLKFIMESMEQADEDYGYVFDLKTGKKKIISWDETCEYSERLLLFPRISETEELEIIESFTSLFRMKR